MGTPEDQAPSTVETNPSLPADYAALSTLVPRVIAATALVMVAFIGMRGTNGSKTWDRAMFVVAVALAAALCVQFLMRPPRRVASIAVCVVAVGGLTVGIACIERPTIANLIWEGFGIPAAIVALVLAVFLWRGLDGIDASRTFRNVFTTGVAIIAALDLVSLVRTLAYFVDAPQNIYILNEMLAPAAGRVPSSTFVPQYVTLYGWVLVPFRSVLSAWALAQFATLLLSAFAIAAVVLGVVIARRSLSRPSFWLAAGIVVPLTCVTVSLGRQPVSSIGSYIQDLAVRLFPAMLLSFLGIEALARLRVGSIRAGSLTALGALAGLIAWNSQDFGIAVTVAYSIVLVVALPSVRFWQSIGLWVIGLVGGLAIYPALAFLAGASLRLDYFALFSRAFAGGFTQARMQVPGPAMVVLPVVLASAGVGLCLLVRERQSRIEVTQAHDRAVLTLALVGTWSTAGFVYYLNRSFAAGQLQILLLPCGVCIVALVSLSRDARARLPGAEVDAFRTSVGLLPIALLAALGFAAMVFQSPSAGTTFHGLMNGREPFKSEVISHRTIRAAQSFAKQRGGSLGYFGNNGSYVHLWTGLPDLLLFDDPEQFNAGPTLRREACRYLDAHATDWLLVSPRYRPASRAALDICGSYQPVDAAGLPPETLYEHVTAR